MADDLVLVTGAGGFLGSNIASTLSEAGRVVVVCDTFEHNESWQYLASVPLHDVIVADDLYTWLGRDRKRLGAIVHLAAISATTETNAAKIITSNIRLTLDLWEHATEIGVPFIYASSAATYGDGSAGFVDDDSPSALASLRPLNLYAWSKHAVDRRIIDDVVAGRPTPPKWAGLKFFNVYGPNEAHKGPMRSVVHQIYPTAARGEAVRLFKSDCPGYPDGGQLRDFVYAKDCSEVVRRILDAPMVSGIFNVGTGTARSFADLATAVFTALGREPKIEYVAMPSSLRGKYQYFTQADTRKLESAGLAPAFHSLEEGVADYVKSHLATELVGRPSAEPSHSSQPVDRTAVGG